MVFVGMIWFGFVLRGQLNRQRSSYNESDRPESIINDRGAAVGGADTSVPDPFAPNCFGYIDCFVTDAYVWQGGVLTDLGALIPGYSSFASTMNARGEAVGVS